MHVTDISFCASVGYNLRNDADKVQLLDELERLYGVRVLRRHHDKLTAEAARMVEANPHMAAVRTNGNPYLLYLTKLGGSDVEHCVFIDKKIQQGYQHPRIILSRFAFDACLFRGTLIEGEMVRRNDGSWVFVMGDLLVQDGELLARVNLPQRISRLYGLLDRHFHADPVFDVCDMQVKRYFRLTELQDMLDIFVPSLDYTCRGVYFKPLFLRFKDVLWNFDDSLVRKVVRTRYKDTSEFLLLPKPLAVKDQPAQQPPPPSPPPPPPPDRSADRAVFWVRKGGLPEVYELYQHQNDVVKRGAVPIGEAAVPDLRTSRMLRQLFLSCSVTDSLPMRCTRHPRFDKWVPVEVVAAVGAA